MGVVLAAWIIAHRQDALERWVKFDFRTELIRPAELQGQGVQDLMLIRGVLCGKRGRVFRNPAIQEVLNSLSWYKGDPEYSPSRLTATEVKNLDLLRSKEASLRPAPVLGDLRWWTNRRITQESVADASADELRLMRAEILAAHGAEFKAEPDIRAYMNERYWYRPSPTTTPLTKTEEENVRSLAEWARAKRPATVLPGELSTLPRGPIKLKGTTLRELRLMRNELFARNGHVFSAEWLKAHFSAQEWYCPMGEERPLTGPAAALAVTLAEEESKRLKEIQTTNLVLDDWREVSATELKFFRAEIEARKGKRFAVPALRTYFEGQAWYQPIDVYSDDLLSPVEKANRSLLFDLEGQASTKWERFEGD
jgi:hypothetical protein